MRVALALEVNHPAFFPGTYTGVLGRFLVQLVQLLFGQFQVNHSLATMRVNLSPFYTQYLRQKSGRLCMNSADFCYLENAVVD
jgi:hypothetical protein